MWQSEADKLRKEIKELKEKQKVRDLKQELADLKKGPSVNLDQIEFKHDTIYFRSEEEPFTGTLIEFHVDGSSLEKLPTKMVKDMARRLFTVKTDRSPMKTPG